MDTVVGLFFALIFLLAIFFGLALLYKNREKVGKWLNSPYYASDDRELHLRRQIEDAEKELEEIEKRKAKTETEE